MLRRANLEPGTGSGSGRTTLFEGWDQNSRLLLRIRMHGECKPGTETPFGVCWPIWGVLSPRPGASTQHTKPGTAGSCCHLLGSPAPLSPFQLLFPRATAPCCPKSHPRGRLPALRQLLWR